MTGMSMSVVIWWRTFDMQRVNTACRWIAPTAPAIDAVVSCVDRISSWLICWLFRQRRF